MVNALLFIIKYLPSLIKLVVELLPLVRELTKDKPKEGLALSLQAIKEYKTGDKEKVKREVWGLVDRL